MGIAAAAVVALGLVLQRYALNYPKPSVPLGPYSVSRDWAWIVALVVYGVGQGLMAGAILTDAPLSLLGSMFITLLFFNLFFANQILGEELAPVRILGASIVFVGMVLASVGTPGTNAKDNFTERDIEKRFANPFAATYFAIISAVGLGGLVLATWFERSYPYEPGTETPRRPPPASLHTRMSVLLPILLGCDQGLTQLTLRGVTSMIQQCGRPALLGGGCGGYALPLMLVFFVLASLATLFWMRWVYRRFEITDSITLEYGTISLAAIFSGLIFFGNVDRMEGWQQGCTWSGVVVMIIGLAVSISKRCWSTPARSSHAYTLLPSSDGSDDAKGKDDAPHTVAKIDEKAA